jgi:hypothetical protein
MSQSQILWHHAGYRDGRQETSCVFNYVMIMTLCDSSFFG